jgi:cysteinyl-tRNA synthetase
VYNSLTRSKVPFVPIKGANVTWYSCGPTVYDASHLGHARNYVTQDFLRRILRDYFGFDVHFVMNITDIDDKIILKARYTYLLEAFRQEHVDKGLDQSLLDDVKAAWSVFFRKTLKKLAPKPPLAEPQEPEDEAAWEEVARRMVQDAAWTQSAIDKEPKTTMWFKALDRSRQAIIAATMSVTAKDSSKETAASLIDASSDILAPYIDAQKGQSVTDPAVFRKTAAFWEGEFFKDMRSLHVERPTTLTRVSEYVPEIVTFIEKIIANGYAYEDAGPGNGKKNVWFDTRAFDGAKRSEGQVTSSNGVSEDAQDTGKHAYAKLAPWSKGNKELLEEGEGSLSTGNSTVAGKRAPSDFALWKSSKPGEPAWDSPWGPGRPGWHIECSVMASEVLGQQIDVHSGGVDLMFPHHDNELAQSEAHHNCAQWINYFLHTGHLHIEGLKMSKSLKNFITIEEALQKYSARQLRLAFLLQLWSARMDFKESAMAEVRNVETTLNNFFGSARANIREARARGETFSDGQNHYGEQEKDVMEALRLAQVAFRKAMCDSIDTVTGVTVLMDIVSKTNVYERSRSRADVNVSVIEAVAEWVTRMLRMLGLGEGPIREGDLGWGEAVKAGQEGQSIDREDLLMPYLRAMSTFRDAVRALARNQAPHKELLQLADKLRDQDMVDLGVALEDQEDGRALVKLVDAAQLQAARSEKERAQADKAAKKAEAAAKAEAVRKEKLLKGKTAPSDLFRSPNVNGKDFSAWDERGLPTHDGEGKELSKSKRKACEKEFDRQTKAHAEYLAAKEAGLV